MEKSTQSGVAEFAFETMLTISQEQPNLFDGLGTTVDIMTGPADEENEQQKERDYVLLWAMMGMMYNTIKAQIEADAMADLFAEE